jgi:GTP-binding protein HflX
VYNKIDKLDRRARHTSNQKGEGRAVWLSASSAEGIPMLLQMIGDRLRRNRVNGVLHLCPDHGRQRAVLFDLGVVTREETADDGGWNIEINMSERDFQRFMKRENLQTNFLAQQSVAIPVTAVT